MSTWKPEETPRLEAESISEPLFATVWRGFDPGQVSEYLKGVAGRLRVLENRAWELESELEQARMQQGTSPGPASPADPLDAVSERVAEVVRAFDQDVDRIRSEAEAEAQRIVDEAKAEAQREVREIEERRVETKAKVEEILAEARAEADRIRVDAQAKAEDIKARAERALEDARAKATEVLGPLDDRRRSLINEIRSLHDRMLGSAKELAPVLDEEPAADEVMVVEDGADGSDQVSEAEGLVSPAG